MLFFCFCKKIIQGITQDSENIVVAKGDIPTPEKFTTNILNLSAEKLVDQLTLVETALKMSLLTVKKIN